MEHFNKLTPGEQERLALLMEECAEVIHAVGKILRHGYDSSWNGGPTNQASLEREVGHVGFAINLLVDEGDLNPNNLVEYMDEKDQNIDRFLHHNGGSQED